MTVSDLAGLNQRKLPPPTTHTHPLSQVYYHLQLDHKSDQNFNQSDSLNTETESHFLTMFTCKLLHISELEVKVFLPVALFFSGTMNVLLTCLPVHLLTCLPVTCAGAAVAVTLTPAGCHGSGDTGGKQQTHDPLFSGAGMSFTLGEIINKD